MTTPVKKAPERVRNDALAQSQATLAQQIQNKRLAFGSGWLYPQIAWATYSQNGVVREVINRRATTMLSKPWAYERSDVPYEWGPIHSDLETLGIKQSLRSCVIWMMVFGGAGILLDVDDAFSGWDTPLDASKVRRIKRLIPKTAISLRPHPAGTSYADCEFFYDEYTRDSSRRKVHRSRVIPIVAHDVPSDLGNWSAQVMNTLTGWPPSWIESVYTALCEWNSADKNVGTIIRTTSLLYMQLKGFRKAATSPDSEEAAEVEALLESIAENLDNEGLLTVDHDDTLNEVGRNTAGLADLLQHKKLTFVASVGDPRELVLMESVGNLGTNSGPIDAYNQKIDGLRQDTLTVPITTITDIQLAVAHKREPEIEVPREYTITWAPLSEQSGEEQANQRFKEAQARKADVEVGVPSEVVMSDPSLDVYAGMANYRSEQIEQAQRAKELEAESDKVVIPEGELESAASIARRLGVSSSTVISLMRQGKIEGRKVGSRWKFHWPSVWKSIEGEPVEEAKDRMDSTLGLSESDRFGSVFGASAAMREIFAVLERVSPSSIPVLITGESGTGKEGVARGIHEASGRAGEFVALNCAALPREPDEAAGELMEACTLAAGGTVFLDEVGELDATGQAAALRVLGGDHGDARVVSATWRDLRDGFRLDLYNRLAGIEVEVPPLRDRESDVVELAKMFLTSADIDAGRPERPEPFTPGAVAAMQVYTWPGNVRELKNAVNRGALFADPGSPVEAEHMQIGGRR